MRRAALALLGLLCVVAAPPSRGHDLVLAGGRVIDPETGLDAIRNVGIDGDTITQISTEPLEGTRVIDASGLVIAPGFIDLHQHAQNQDGYRLMALDGVTARSSSSSAFPTSPRGGGRPIHRAIRPLSSTRRRGRTERLDRILDSLRDQIEAGALGRRDGTRVLAGGNATRGDRDLRARRTLRDAGLRPPAQRGRHRAGLERRVRRRGHRRRGDQRRAPSHRPRQQHLPRLLAGLPVDDGRRPRSRFGRDHRGVSLYRGHDPDQLGPLQSGLARESGISTTTTSNCPRPENA